MVFDHIEKCSVNMCPEHDMKCKFRFNALCDNDRCDICTKGYNCIRCRKYDTCKDGNENEYIQRVRRHQLNNMYRDAPKTSPVIHICIKEHICGGGKG